MSGRLALRRWMSGRPSSSNVHRAYMLAFAWIAAPRTEPKRSGAGMGGSSRWAIVEKECASIEARVSCVSERLVCIVTRGK